VAIVDFSESDSLSYVGYNCFNISYVDNNSPLLSLTDTPYFFNNSSFCNILPAIVFKPRATCPDLFWKISVPAVINPVVS